MSTASGATLFRGFQTERAAERHARRRRILRSRFRVRRWRILFAKHARMVWVAACRCRRSGRNTEVDVLVLLEVLDVIVGPVVHVVLLALLIGRGGRVVFLWVEALAELVLPTFRRIVDGFVVTIIVAIVAMDGGKFNVLYMNVRMVLNDSVR